jgi:hypothetical protein
MAMRWPRVAEGVRGRGWKRREVDMAAAEGVVIVVSVVVVVVGRGRCCGVGRC